MRLERVQALGQWQAPGLWIIVGPLVLLMVPSVLEHHPRS